MYQKLVIVGSLGNDPESRYTPAGTMVTNFSLATNRQYTKKSGERIKETVWWRVSVWGASAEACQKYLQKGSKALVEGRMNATPEGNPRVWGEGKASYEVTADTVKFLGSKGDAPVDGKPGKPKDEMDSPF